MPDVAQGAATPFWPMPSIAKRVATYGGKAFGASRRQGRRRHAGVDILAPQGAEVVAPESGTVVATQRFNGPLAHALLIQTDTGPVILLGEVEPGSWNQYNAGIGSRVEAGQPVAQVGINPGGSTMLHYEMYREGTAQNHQWWKSAAAPTELLDPTVYLEAAAGGEPVVPVPSDDIDREHQEETETPHDPGEDVMPTVDDGIFDPTIPATPTETWANNRMSPADFDEYYEAGYLPVGRWNIQQTACTQQGATYEPRATWGTGTRDSTGDCRFPSGTVCPSWEVLTGRCPGDTPPLIPPDEDVTDADVGPDIAQEGDDIDPWDILPDLPDIPGLPKGIGLPFPWWVGAILAGLVLWGWSDRD